MSKITRHQLREIIKEELIALSRSNNLVVLEAGNKRLHVELANCPESRNKGLMYRTVLGEDCGMLFSFPKLEVQSFWMKNTSLPLSIAFINEHGVITNIENMTPFSLDNVFSNQPVKLALEMTHGWFENNCIKPGDVIRGLPDNSAY